MLWILIFIIIAGFGYLMGSIPVGVLIGKKIKGIDIRKVGSGNVGTANAIRALGAKWGGIVFLCDVVKGAFPVLLAIGINQFFPGLIPIPFKIYFPIVAGLFSILGHNNSIFLNFEGGKGIATSFGIFLVLDYRAALLAFLVWVLAIAITKISSLGSLLGALAAPIIMLLFKQPIYNIIFAFIVVSIAFYKHKENIKRLIKGEERKITDKASNDDSSSINSLEKITESINSEAL